MKYTIRGKGDVTLLGKDFMASGGEAQLFKQNKLIYKIYHNKSDMIPDGKIHELQEIKNSKVLIPKDIIFDSKGVRVGFTMDFIDGVTPLCKLFANAYIHQNNVSNDTIIDLVKQMQETINEIHAAKCIQVDGNELNYLVDEKDFKSCYFIDVNSYQTKSFPATVIMPSIRDWTAKSFNELTDWYSFAIITCQLFIGIHPFKGKHPDFKRHDLEKRMISNVSIFNKQVTFPKSVRDFSCIPVNYMDWFIEVFEKGKRLAPPDTVGAVDAKVRYIVITSTDNFDIKELETYDDVILYHSNLNNISITRTSKSIFVGNNQYAVSRGVYLIHSPKNLTPILVKINNYNVEVKSLNKHTEVKLGSEISADELLVINDTLYIRSGNNLIETKFLETNVLIIIVIKNVWSISSNSTKFFKGCFTQDLLGSKYVSIPTPSLGLGKLTTNRCKELDPYTILDAKYEDRVSIFSVVDTKENKYGLMVIVGVEDDPNIRFINTIESNPVNFVVLDNGIVILIYDDQMEIFSNKFTSGSKVKIIKDKELNSDMLLCKRGVEARFFTDNKLYSLKMRK